MTELICWPLDNKQYTSVALGAAYAARSRGVLNADSFAAKTNGNNTVTVGKGVGCIHVSDQWAAFPFSQGDVTLTFEDADGVNPRWDAIALAGINDGSHEKATVTATSGEVSRAFRDTASVYSSYLNKYVDAAPSMVAWKIENCKKGDTTIKIKCPGYVFLAFFVYGI